MEPKPSTDGVYPLFSRLCESVLAQTYAKGGSRGDHLHMNFESPKYDILRRGLDHRIVVQHLVRTTFDLILLQKWVWFGTWQTDMSPECRCLAHTYEMNLKGRHEEAARLECTVSSLKDSDCLVEKGAVLKFLALMAGSGELKDQTSAPFLPSGGNDLFHYETYPSSLFEQLPAGGHVHGLNLAALESAELFNCTPGTGFAGFFTAKSLPPAKAPGATTLFDGLAHCMTSDLNTPLDLPNIPSQADSISLLPHQGEKVDRQALCLISGQLSDSGCGLNQDDSALSLLSSLAMSEDTPLLTRAWEGWEDSKQYLSESAHGTFDCSVEVCLSRLTPLTNIELPLDVTGGPGALRKLVATLVALPTTVLQPLEEGGSIARAFARAVSSLLLHCQMQLHELEGKSDLYLQFSANAIFHLVRFLVDLVTNISSCPKGLPLLDQLYTQAVGLQGTPHYPLLLSLLRLAAMPYLQFVCQWVFHGWLDREEEFGVHAHEGFLTKRDHHYWTEGYTASSPCTPEFLRQHSTTFLTAGKALNLLKMCCPTHPLCDRLLKPPSVAIAISMEELQGIGQQCKAYTSMVNLAVEKQEEERRLRELEREQLVQEVFIRARQKARQAVQRSRSHEQAQLQVLQERKRALHKDLKQQMEEARALRSEREAEEREADKELMEAAVRREKALGSQERELEEEAKTELVSYYDELSREAETRRLRAEWRVRRLKLTVERRGFIEDEQERWTREMERGGVTESRRVEPVTPELVETTDEEISSTREAVEEPSQGEGQRTRRTWTEAPGPIDPEGEPTEPGGRKTWVASLIESVPPLTFPSPAEAANENKNISPSAPPSVLKDSKPSTDPPSLPLAPSTPPKAHPSTPEQSPQSGSGEKAKSSPLQRSLSSPLQRSPSSPLQRSPSFLGQHYSPTEDTKLSCRVEYSPRRKTVPGSGIHDSVVQKVLYGQDQEDQARIASRVSSERTSGTGSGQPAGLESGHEASLSPRLVSSRGHAPPSVAQDIIYLEVAGATPKSGLPEDFMTPRIVSSRGSQPASVARDIIYPREGHELLEEGKKGTGEGASSGDLLTPRMRTSRGHALPSVVQDILYAREAPLSGVTVGGWEDHGHPRLVSSRGHAPPSTIQDILYSRGHPSLEKFQSARGTPPPSSIEYKLYPGKYTTVVESAKPPAQEEGGENVSGKKLPPFQPYRDSYPELDLPPSVDFLFHLLGPPPPSRPTDPALLSVYPLPALVEDSIALPIHTQSLLVNSALVEHFITEYQISRHFVALKRFLLLEDGEFGHSLATRLFEELTYGQTWRSLCSPSFLNPLLSSALDNSLHRHTPETKFLSFALRHQPQGIKTHAVEALEFLELQYKVEWPCNIVITRDSIAKYNKVFQLLLQLKRASWALKNVFAHLKKCEGLDKGQHRQLQTYRHELQHFINVMEGYLMNQIFYLSWREFEVEMSQTVHSLDDLITAHKNFIDKVIFRCLLSKKAKPVMNIIRGVFSAILKFSAQLTMSVLDARGSYRAMCDTHRRFRDAAGLLIKVVTKLVQRGYQPHLEDFMLRLDFSGFYAGVAEGVSARPPAEQPRTYPPHAYASGTYY